MNFAANSWTDESLRELNTACAKDPKLRAELLDQARRWKTRNPDTRVVAITGSYGKTSLKEYLGHCLRGYFGDASVVTSIANHNTKVSIAAQLLSLEQPKLAIFEVGMAKPQDADLPVQLLDPEIAIVTKIGSAHLQAFDSLKSLTKEKLKIFQGPNLKFGILPASALDTLNTLKIVKSYEAQFQPLGPSPMSHKHSEARPPGSNTRIVVHANASQSPFYPPQNMHPFFLDWNAHLIALGEYMCLDVSHLLSFQHTFQAPPRRFEFIKGNSQTRIDDAYNSSPESLKHALSFLFESPCDFTKLTLVLGPMLELGPLSEQIHQDLGAWIRAKSPQTTLVTIGKEALSFHPKGDPTALHFDSIELAKNDIPKILASAQIVYLKASKAANFPPGTSSYWGPL